MRKYALVLILAAASVACGGKSKDAANVMGGLAGSTSGSGAALMTADLGKDMTLVQKIRETRQGMLWLARFKMESEQQKLAQSLSSGVAPMMTLPCNGGVMSGSGFSCSESCNSAQTVSTVSCTIPDGKASTCDGVNYTFSSGSFSVSMDASSVTYSGGTYTGAFGIGFGFGANVTGGDLDGQRLECNFSMSFDLGKLMAGQETDPTLTCGSNFSCKYADDEIDCDDLQDEMGEGTNSCS